MKPVVIHTHLHKRKTGVTRSIENVLPILSESLETYVYGTNIGGNLISKKDLKKHLFSERNVVVHAHRNNEILQMLWFRLLGSKFKLVATRHSATKPSGLTRFLLKKVDKVVSLVTSVHQNLGIENVLIPHGVNTDDFQPKADVKLQFVTQSKIILNTGRIRKPKGQMTLIKAARVLKDYPNWALVFVGKIDDSKFHSEMIREIEKSGIQHQVYFIPETTFIIPYYQAASLFVAPSHSEGFALVTAEAMACECTVIATKNVGVHSEMIQDGKTGHLFESENHKELEVLLKDVISGQRSETGMAARAEIINNWSAKKEAERLVRLYADL